MRESNFTFPPQNRAVVNITHLLYDRRALDTSSPLAILNNLTSLTYLTSTSPRIREILTTDGGLERLLDILRDSLLPRDGPTPPDLWGLNGPHTARVISVDRSILLRHCLAFQCVVNIGVRGSEAIRTRVVQAGALDLVAQILESWLKQHGVYIFASPVGSEVAVANHARIAASLAPAEPSAQPPTRHRSGSSRHVHPQNTSSATPPMSNLPAPALTGWPGPSGGVAAGPSNATRARGSFTQFVVNFARGGRRDAAPAERPQSAVSGDTEMLVPDRSAASSTASTDTGIEYDTRAGPSRQIPANGRGGGDTDVDMADEEGGGETDSISLEMDDSMEVDEPRTVRGFSALTGGLVAPAAGEMETEEQMDEGESTDGPMQSGPSTTPRASQVVLPLMMSIPNGSNRLMQPDEISQASSAGNSYSDDAGAAIQRTASDNSLALTASQTIASGSRPPPLNIAAVRMPVLAAEPTSTQSSPMGTPLRMDHPEIRPGGRRDTIVARPVNLALPARADRPDRGDGANSEASDVDVDLQTATINANIRAVRAQPQMLDQLGDTGGPNVNVNLVVAAEDEDPARDALNDDEAMAAEQARLDMEAGAPPGQPGAAQTPRIPPNQDPTPRAALLAPPALPDPTNPQQPAQIIIASGAPRGFNDLGSYVGISSLLNPEGDRYSDDAILLSLQLLAYLSKYPHVRSSFHHPRRPMHPTFNLSVDTDKYPLPERPACSKTPNIFSLVERFTFRPSPSDPEMFRIPPEIQYWAGVIMRNACRKDEANGGIRQCANMDCGKWETYPREFAKCRRCRKAKYCSKECQSKAWAEGHKFWCNVRNDEPGAGGPGPGGGGAGGGGGGGGGGRGDDPDGDDDDDNTIFGNGAPRDMPSRIGRIASGPHTGTTNPRHPTPHGHAAGAPSGTHIYRDPNAPIRIPPYLTAGAATQRPRPAEPSVPSQPMRGNAAAAYDPILPDDAQLNLLLMTANTANPRTRVRATASVGPGGPPMLDMPNLLAPYPASALAAMAQGGGADPARGTSWTASARGAATGSGQRRGPEAR